MIFLFYTALFILFAWISWKFIPIEWIKYLATGVFSIVATWEFWKFIATILI